jgi:hypothetical protein
MKWNSPAALLLCAGVLAASVKSAPDVPDSGNDVVQFAELPRLFPDYKVDPYIRAAIHLQSLGKDRGCEKLMAFAKRKENEFWAYRHAAEALERLGVKGRWPGLLWVRAFKAHAEEWDDYEKLAVLCRMVFVSRPAEKFMRPSLGGPSFFGKTDTTDWPLEPIELVDGVPFLISWGYISGGEALPPCFYVQYCIDNCDWNAVRFAPKTDAEKAKALEKLLSSKKWKEALRDWDKRRLASQIK